MTSIPSTTTWAPDTSHPTTYAPNSDLFIPSVGEGRKKQSKGALAGMIIGLVLLISLIILLCVCSNRIARCIFPPRNLIKDTGSMRSTRANPLLASSTTLGRRQSVRSSITRRHSVVSFETTVLEQSTLDDSTLSGGSLMINDTDSSGGESPIHVETL